MAARLPDRIGLLNTMAFTMFRRVALPSFAELRPIWGQYYVGSDAGEVNPGAVAASRPRADLIGHTSIIYVIDPQGRIRAFLPGNFEPTDLAKDLRLLVEHRGRGPWSHSGMP